MSRCHDCYCHLSPPCEQCVDCAHSGAEDRDVADCPNDCQECGDHRLPEGDQDSDPFTSAAMAHLAKVDHDKSHGWFEGFVACFSWAHDHLAAQEPTAAEIEAGKAVLESAGLTVFDGHLPGLSEHLARKVLIAARGALHPAPDARSDRRGEAKWLTGSWSCE